MYLIDTNIMYLLAEIEKNKFDLSKIKNFCSNNKCAIDLYSIFEIYNNSNLSLTQIKQIVDTMKKKNILVCCNDTMRSTFQESLNLGIVTEEKRKLVKSNLSKGIIPVYSHLITVLTSINFFILYFFCKNVDDNYFKELGSFIGEVLPVIDEKVQKLIESSFNKNCFSEKQIKIVYGDLLSFYMFTVMCFDETYLKNNSEPVNHKKYFSLLLEKFKNSEITDCCMRFVMEGVNNNGASININMYSLIFKQEFPTEKDADCFFDDIVNIIYGNTGLNLEKMWMKNMIKTLLYNEANLKSNNFIDFLIIRDFTLSSDYTHLITCDKAMRNTMKELKSCDKINDSINLMEELLTKKAD